MCSSYAGYMLYATLAQVGRYVGGRRICVIEKGFPGKGGERFCYKERERERHHVGFHSFSFIVTI